MRQSVDLRIWDSPVESQGQLGSCEGNAIASAYELQVKRLYPNKFVELSRLFVYYNTRLLDNAVMEDSGAYIRDGMKALNKFGICAEILWPYDIEKFTVKPSDACYADALLRTITSYQLLETIDDLLQAVNANTPVVIGLTVYDSFDQVSIKNPVIPMPTSNEMFTGGGHAMTVVGYDLSKQQLIVKNSYGTAWGEGGYAWLPFDYVRTQVFEMWIFEIGNQTLVK